MVPSPAFLTWLFESSAWLLERLGGARALKTCGAVITPTREDFPVDPALSQDELFDDYFLFVLEHARLAHWPYELALDDLRGPRNVRRDESALERRLLVPVERGVRDATNLVATMARGVAHHVVAKSATLLADDEAFELMIDLAAVWLGFGVFTANTSGRRGFAGVWLPQTALGELENSYALALFAILTETADARVTPFLRANPQAFYRAASRELLRNHGPAIRRLRAVAPTPYRTTAIVHRRSA